MARIRIGRFDQFKGADTVLIEVDGDGLRVLMALVTALADGSQPRAGFHCLPGATAYGGVVLVGEVTPRDFGVREVRRGEFIWRLSRTGWADRANRLSGLEHVASGHQYLEGPTDLIQVIAATGEYREEWWSHVLARPD